MPQNRLLRALCALPILAMGIPMHRVLMFMLAPLGPVTAKFQQQSAFELQNGTTIPIINDYYGVPAVDSTLSPIAIFFSYFLLEDVPELYWECLIFLTDITAMYAVMVLESFRNANQGTFFQSVFIIAILGQLGGLGNLSPAYHYFLYVFRPIEKLATTNARLIDGAGAVSILPVVVTVMLIPHFLSFFHQDFEARLWWNWLWQLFPVWSSLSLFVLTRVISSAGLLDNRVEAVQKRNRTVTRFTLGALSAVSAVVYWYALLSSSYSLDAMFIPKYFWELPATPGDSIKTFMQYDYIICAGSPLLWLAYSFYDLKVQGICKASWVRIVSTALAVGLIGGPGTLVCFGWVAREETMSSMGHGKTA